MKARTFVALAVSTFCVWAAANVALGAYRAHQNDRDVNRFLSLYGFTRPTRLNDCALCHPGGQVSKTYYGSCDYCHEVYGLEPPHGEIPLNSFGLAYLHTGRTSGALKQIETLDSDGDSYTNGEEIHALTFPGDEADYPGLVPASSVTLNKKDIKKLIQPHKQFLLINTTRQGDFYAEYEGAPVKDLLESVGRLPEATHITVFAPDGFSKTFPIDDPENEVYDVMGPYPRGYYYSGIDFVEYPARPTYEYGQPIPGELHMLLAFKRQGGPLEKGRLELSEGRMTLEGEGPLRLVVPQKTAGSPDRSVKDPPQGDIWDYNSEKDHNAGYCVRSITAIRVEPLPEGSTDFNWFEGGWEMVDENQLVIYGAIDPPTYPVTGDISAVDGSPLEGVQVSFGHGGWTATDGAGRFQLDLPLGRYTMIPSAPGYVFRPEQVSFDLQRKGYSRTFVGYDAQEISGYITTSRGTPVPGVTMKVKKKTSATDTNGQHVQSLVAGVYRLRPRAKGFSFVPRSLRVDCTRGDVPDADFVATDKQRPRIRFADTEKSLQTTDEQVYLSVTATDNLMVREVTWKNGEHSGLAQQADGNNWSALVLLEPGRNQIIFTVADEEGNMKRRRVKAVRK